VQVIDGADMTPDVEIVLRLPQSVVVRSEDQAQISTFGLLGEKFIEIIPGRQSSPPLPAGGALRGKPPVSMDQVIERSNKVLTDLERMLSGINSFVEDPEARSNLRQAISELRDAAKGWKDLNLRLHEAMTHVQAGQGNLGKLLYDEGLYTNLNDFVTDIRAHPWKLLVRPKEKKK
jgi:phospholipid/cholesterol/gamma-HCH transport system substrate-binding protein